MSKSKRQFNSAIPLTEPGGKTIYLRWRILFTIFLLIALILLTLLASSPQSVGAAPAVANVQQKLTNPKVVAFYYTWFDEASWNSTLSDQPVQPYVSRDRGTMGRHIDLAKQAGIDGFVVAWYGPTGQFNQTEPNLVALLEEAAARDFRIGILFETDSPFFSGFGDVTNALSHALSNHIHHPAYLRTAQGAPLLFFWRTQAYSVAQWQQARSQVDPGYSSVWISDGIDTSYLSTFDGHHLYSNTWNPPSDLTYTNQKFANWVTQAGNQFGAPKAWVATVMPGYNDVGIRGSGGFAKGREGGSYFDRSWQAAIASQPDWIMINSFNEWPEGTYIEPSVTFGDQFIRSTSAWSQQFKQRTPVNNLAPAAAPPAAPATAAIIEAPLTEANGATVPFGVGDKASVAVDLLNLRESPDTSAKVLTVLSVNEELLVEAVEPTWLLVNVDGQSGWVYRSMVGGLEVADSSSLSEANSRTISDIANQSLEAAREEPIVQQSGQRSSTPGEKASYPRFIPNPTATSSSKTVGSLLDQTRFQFGQTVTVDVGILNLRSDPSVAASVLAELPYGSDLVIENISSAYPDWIQVRHDQNARNEKAILGWVYASMVK